MENKIKSYLDGLFAGAVNCDAKDEIMAELFANLCEKYEDLVASGQTPDEAYATVIDGIGDIDEIVSFINANNRRSDFDFSSAFEGFETRMKDLAKELEEPFQNVMGDLKNAALNVRDAAMSAKEPIKEMAKQMGHEMKNVGREVKDVVSKIEFSQQGKNTFRYDYEVPAASIRGLDIASDSGNVTFGVSQNDNIYVVELSRQPLDGDKRANIDLQNGILSISHGKSQVGFFFFGIGVFSSDFEIYLPKAALESVMIRTSSGYVDLDVELDCKHIKVSTSSGDVSGSDIRCPDLNISSTSGDIELDGVLSQAANIHTTSGDITLDGEFFEAEVVSTSGDLEISGAVKELEVKTSSGDIELDGMIACLTAKTISGDLDARLSDVPQAIRIDTVSGDSKLYLPENEGFTLNYKRVSGDIKSDFNLLTSINSKEGHGVYRDGNLRTFFIGTVSGDIKLLKR